MKFKCGGYRRRKKRSEYLSPASVFVILLVASAACHDKVPKAGDVCGAQDEGTLVCENAGTALLCKAQIRKSVPCRGPKGCTAASCDETVSRVGEACEESKYADAPRVACSEDKQTQLTCQKGRFELALHCRGANGCNGATCDRSLAVGDECYELDGWEQCVAGKMATAACDKDRSNKLEIVRVCSGPEGCRSIGSSTFCDVSVATPGAPCGKRQTDLFTCDPLRASLLQCSPEAQVWQQSRACDKGEHCATGLGTRGAECIR